MAVRNKKGKMSMLIVTAKVYSVTPVSVASMYGGEAQESDNFYAQLLWIRFSLLLVKFVLIKGILI